MAPALGGVLLEEFAGEVPAKGSIETFLVECEALPRRLKKVIVVATTVLYSKIALEQVASPKVLCEEDDVLTWLAGPPMMPSVRNTHATCRAVFCSAVVQEMTESVDSWSLAAEFKECVKSCEPDQWDNFAKSLKAKKWDGQRLLSPEAIAED